MIREDTNTRGYCYWFYFSVSKMEVGQTYTFHLVNLSKNFALYYHAMRPVAYSEMRAHKNNKDWS